MPAIIPTKRTNPVRIKIKPGDTTSLILKFISANWLNTGSKISTKIKLIMKDTTVNKSDSHQNCFIILFRAAPNIFLTPTSFARVVDLPKERVIKLMHAIDNIINAMMESI